MTQTSQETLQLDDVVAHRSLLQIAATASLAADAEATLQQIVRLGITPHPALAAARSLVSASRAGAIYLEGAMRAVLDADRTSIGEGDRWSIASRAERGGLGEGASELSDCAVADLGGLFSTRTLGRWEPQFDSPLDRGRNTVASALAVTGDGCTLAADEVGIIAMDDGAHIVILPGVTDLTEWGRWVAGRAVRGFEPRDRPPLGLNPQHRSVRDLDWAAIASSKDSLTAHDQYALYVKAALRHAGVPAGANVMLVGHSFGADAALDLAHDPTFNIGTASDTEIAQTAVSGYRVTHVLAAGYDTADLVEGIPRSTAVLALENRFDLVVKAEQAGRIMRNRSDGDHADQVDDHAGLGSDGQVRIVFGGGVGSDVGHHPDRYAGFIASTSDDRVERFLASVGDTFDGTGVRLAVDVSVPSTTSNGEA